MTRALAVVACLAVVGCSSTTNVTNVYVGDDAASDARADTVGEAASADTRGADVSSDSDASGRFACAKDVDCGGGACCAVGSVQPNGKLRVDGSYCDASGACVLSSGVVAPRSCVLQNDCKAGETCCYDGFAHSYCTTGPC